MPLPWKKSKSGRISRFVTDLQHSPKHGGSLFVETGFPTSLIDLFVKNRDRLKKSSSKRNNNNKAPTQTAPTRPRVLSPPLPQKLDPASVTEDHTASKVDEDLDGGSGLTSENRHDGDSNNDDGGARGGGCCVLTVVIVKVFALAVLAWSTKKLAVGITISAFALILLELAVVRVFTLLNLCPDAEVRLHSLFGKLIGKKKRKKKVEESSSSSSMQERENNKVSLEIIESFQDSRDCVEEVQVPPEEREEVLVKEKSKSAKLKSKIVKKIVPKKLRSYKKKKKLKMKEKQEAQGGEVDVEEESLTEVSSLYSEDRIERGVSERDETGSNPPLLESCEEVEEEEEEEESGSKGDLTKVIVLVVIALAGLLSGKVIAFVLTLSWCLILRFVCCKSQTSH